MKLPDFLKRPIIDIEKTKKVRRLLKKNCLHTICESGRCPNKAECYNNNTASFLIMGDICTRNCRFCNVKTGIPLELNIDEPENLAKAISELNLDYAVITSVTRDDLKDGGAGHFAKVINAIRKFNKNTKVEVLVPDFKGSETDINTVLLAQPDVFNHNIETIPRLYKKARPQADFQRSLDVLKYSKLSHPDIYTKTGLMIGLGESIDELIDVFKLLNQIDCDIVTIGQYMQPTKAHLPVVKYYEPSEYENLTQIAKEIGIKTPVFAPLVRSSYKAYEAINNLKKNSN